MSDKCVSNEVRLTASRRGGDNAAIDRQKVDLNRHFVAISKYRR
jgi:hypothetical protein